LQHGFTLIGIMVVIVILGILAALVVARALSSHILPLGAVSVRPDITLER